MLNGVGAALVLEGTDAVGFLIDSRVQQPIDGSREGRNDDTDACSTEYQAA
jgi:hypothetical protein